MIGMAVKAVLGAERLALIPQRLSRVPGIEDYLQFFNALADPNNAEHLKTPGHHWYIMARESLLAHFEPLWDRFSHQFENISSTLAEGSLLACSLPELLPQVFQEKVAGYFIRGEFLRLAFFHNSANPKDPESYISDLLPGRDLLPGGRKFIEHMENHLVPYVRGKEIVYRLTDRLEEYKFLPFNGDNDNSRGAEYLLSGSDAAKALLKQEIEVIGRLAREAKKVTVLIPNTDNPVHFNALSKIISDGLAGHGFAQVEFGLMVEREKASTNLYKFFKKGCRCFFPGPSDLAAEKAETSRSEFGAANLNDDLWVQVLEDYKKGIKELLKKAPKSPIVHLLIKDFIGAISGGVSVWSPLNLFMTKKQIRNFTGVKSSL